MPPPAESLSLVGLLARYTLPAATRPAFERLMERLVSDAHAPTSVRDPAAVLADHLADALSGLSIDVVRAAGAIADIGAGAGLPGLPLAIARPDAAVTLVDSVGRKCAFITELAAACELTNVTVVHARAEAWPEGLGGFEVVTARALARLDVVAEYAAPLLTLGGALVAWRGRRDPADEAAGAVAASRLGLELVEVREVRPYPGAAHRHLHVLRKVAETPPEFPRRAGLARKRPLGGPTLAPAGASSDRGRR